MRRTRTVIGVVLIGAAVGCVLYFIQQPVRRCTGVVAVAINVDANTAGNGLNLVRDEVSDAAAGLADAGGGTLEIVGASGGQAQEIAKAQLDVKRDGQVEHDTTVRRRTVRERIGSAFDQANAALATFNAPGRSLVPLLQMVGRFRPPPGQPFDIYYVGLGLGTVDPSDANVEMRGDPQQVVAALGDRLPNLGARLHVLFPAAVGAQPAFNPLTSQWRTAFWRRLATATGSTLIGPDERNIPAPPYPGAPTAPVINNLADLTVVPAAVINTAAPRAPQVLLAGANFQPDSALFINDDLARGQLQPLITAWTSKPGNYAKAICTGRTLALGPADGARQLSYQRAGHAAELLGAHGIPVDTVGAGYDDPIRGIGAMDARQRSVICQLVPIPK